MAGCYPRECDHHCARVCRQYVCTCDYEPGCTARLDDQRICCKWELVHRPETNTYAYTDREAQVDTLTRYFGVQRSLRDAHDPVRFTGVNHIPSWLHADLSTLDTEYSNLLKEREVMLANRYFGPASFYTYKSIRPYNQESSEPKGGPRGGGSRTRDVEDARRGVQRGKMSVQALRNGQMPFLD